MTMDMQRATSMAADCENNGWTEHAKLYRLQGENDTVQRFLDWLLDEKGYSLMAWREKQGDLNDLNSPYEPAGWKLMPESREQLMAQFFDVDLSKLSNEKQAMYDLLVASKAAS